MQVQWNPALQTPVDNGHFRLFRGKGHTFSLKSTCLTQTPVNKDNGHFSLYRVTNSHISSTQLYRHWSVIFVHSL